MLDQLKLTPTSITKSETAIAIASLLPALIIFAVVPILIKVGEYEINPDTLIFNRFWMALPLLGVWNGVSSFQGRSSPTAISSQFFPQNWKLLVLLILSGVFSGGQQILYAWSLTQTSAANAEVLHSMTPLFITLMGWMFLKQDFERRYLWGIAIAICGSLTLVAHDLSTTLDKLQGDGIALSSAVLWSGYLLVLERLQAQFSISVITIWTCLIGTIFLVPILLINGDSWLPHSFQLWLIVGLLGNLGIVTKISLTYSLKRLSSGLVATILLLHPVITAVLAWRIFSEKLDLLNGLAILSILLGVYLVASSKDEFAQVD